MFCQGVEISCLQYQVRLYGHIWIDVAAQGADHAVGEEPGGRVRGPKGKESVTRVASRHNQQKASKSDRDRL